MSMSVDVSKPWYLWFLLYLVWTQAFPLSPLEPAISLFRGLIKSAPNVLQTASERERGVHFMALWELLAVHSAAKLKDLLCIDLHGGRIPWAVSLIPNFRLFPAFCVSDGM